MSISSKRAAVVLAALFATLGLLAGCASQEPAKTEKGGTYYTGPMDKAKGKEPG